MATTRGSVSEAPAYSVEPLSSETWDLFDDVVDRHGGIFGGCWCIWFHPDRGEAGEGAEGNRARKKRYVEEGQAHAALLVTEQDGQREAIAWAEYGTPQELPNIHHSKQYLAELDLLPDYRVTCIFVDRRYRRQGLAEAALQGALDLIAQAGGGIVEGYPHVNRPEKKISASFLYNGTRDMYARNGFDFIRPKGQFNTVMRRTVPAA